VLNDLKEEEYTIPSLLASQGSAQNVDNLQFQLEYAQTNDVQQMLNKFSAFNKTNDTENQL